MSGGRRLARLAAAAPLAAGTAAPGIAAGVEGFPGSTWGDFYWEIRSPGESDAIWEGWVRHVGCAFGAHR